MCSLIYWAELVPLLHINIDEERKKLWRSGRRLESCKAGERKEPHHHHRHQWASGQNASLIKAAVIIMLDHFYSSPLLLCFVWALTEHGAFLYVALNRCQNGNGHFMKPPLLFNDENAFRRSTGSRLSLRKYWIFTESFGGDSYEHIGLNKQYQCDSPVAAALYLSGMIIYFLQLHSFYTWQPAGGLIRTISIWAWAFEIDCCVYLCVCVEVGEGLLVCY